MRRWYAEIAGVAGVSAPAFVERAGRGSSGDRARLRSVAGVSAPAFVERRQKGRANLRRINGERVAGVSAPAFVERACR